MVNMAAATSLGALHAFNPSDVVGSFDLHGLGHFPRARDSVEPSCDERLRDPRADPLRRSGHDSCLRWVAHRCLPRRHLITGAASPILSNRASLTWLAVP